MHKPMAPAESSGLNSISGLKANFIAPSKIILESCHYHTCNKNKITVAKVGECPPRIIEDLGHWMVENSTPKSRAFETTSTALNGILTRKHNLPGTSEHLLIRTCHASQEGIPAGHAKGIEQ